MQIARLTRVVRAKRAVRCETWRVFKRRCGLRASFYFRTTNWAVRGHHLQTCVCRRFLCFVSFSPLEKETKCRHAQWLIVVSKRLQHQTRTGTRRTSPASSANDRPCRHAQWPIHRAKQETPTSNSHGRTQNQLRLQRQRQTLPPRTVANPSREARDSNIKPAQSRAKPPASPKHQPQTLTKMRPEGDLAKAN
jgi:hypothetical protein